MTVENRGAVAGNAAAASPLQRAVGAGPAVVPFGSVLMKRREFLVGAAGIVGAAGLGLAQGQAPGADRRPRARTEARGGRGGGGRGGPANVPAAKLARIAMMTLNHGSMLKRRGRRIPIQARRCALMDLPQYYMDTYGVRDVEFQHGHLAKDGRKPGCGVLQGDESEAGRGRGSRANQINIEIGTMAQMAAGRQGDVALTGDARATWLEHGEEMGRRRADASGSSV